MTEQPLFSVLIANYNNGHYLREALDSVRQQTYQNWQVVIVDDGSTDNSFEIYKELESDASYKVVLNDENRGCTFTKKRCIDDADGELCGYLDADDQLLPKALEKMVEIHVRNDNAAVVTSKFYFCDAQMNITDESKPIIPQQGESYLTHADFRPAPFISFKKKKYDLTQGLNPNNKIGDDQELLLLLEEVGDYLVLDEFTYKYRQQPNSMIHQRSDECIYWNARVFHEACLRRGIDPQIAVNYYLNYLKNVRGEAEWLSEERTMKKIYSSKAYRLGKSLLKPLSIFKRKPN